jgi:ubiquitin C-terminal hydrolase
MSDSSAPMVLQTLPDQPVLWLGQPLANFSQRPRGGCGLRNVGNSCYMNSVLQALAHCPPLAAFFVGGWPDACFPGALLTPPVTARFEFCSLLADSMIELRAGSLREYNPRRVTESVVRAVPEFRAYGQQDAHEAFNYILNNLHDELFALVPPELHRSRKALLCIEAERNAFFTASQKQQQQHQHQPPSLPPQQQQQQQQHASANGKPRVNEPVPQTHQNHRQSIVGDTFQTVCAQTLTCDTCQSKSLTVEEGFELSLPLPSKSQVRVLGEAMDESSPPSWFGALKTALLPPTHVLELEDCLRAFFTPERMEGADSYFCEACDAKSEAGKSVCLAGLPEILCIHLKRFNKTRSWGVTGSKNTTLVRFPLQGLDLSPHCHKDAMEDTSSMYDLFAVVKHTGSANQGHYICCAKSSSGRWLEFDDDLVSAIPLPESQLQTSDAYMLLYQKRPRSVDLDQKSRAAAALRQAPVSALLEGGEEDAVVYLSKAWALRWESMSNPGPVDNTSFACEHGLCLVPAMREVDQRAVGVPRQAFRALCAIYGGPVPAPEVAGLLECPACRAQYKALEERRADEHRVIGELDRLPRADAGFAVPVGWLTLWYRFIRNDQGPLGRGTWLGAAPPGPIDVDVLRDAELTLKPKLRSKTHYQLVNAEIWKTWVEWYGLRGEPLREDALAPELPGQQQ